MDFKYRNGLSRAIWPQLDVGLRQPRIIRHRNYESEYQVGLKIRPVRPLGRYENLLKIFLKHYTHAC